MSHRSFKRHLPEIYKIGHGPSCKLSKRSAPVKECPCYCYEKAIYELGYTNGEISGKQTKFHELKEDKNGNQN